MAASEFVEREELRIDKDLATLKKRWLTGGRHIYDESDWRLAAYVEGSALESTTFANRRAVASPCRKFVVEMCPSAAFEIDVAPRALGAFHRLLDDVYSELSDETKTTIEYWLDHHLEITGKETKSALDDPTALGVALWRFHIDTFYTDRLLLAQRVIQEGPYAGDTLHVKCKSWRAAMLAWLYSCCEVVRAFRQGVGDLVVPTEILLPCRNGSTYFAWTGRFPELDRVSAREDPSSEPSDLVSSLMARDTARRMQQYHQYVASMQSGRSPGKSRRKVLSAQTRN